MIYLDNHATTACDPLVVEAMLPYFSLTYGNAASPHALGQQAANAVQRAREQVAALLGAQPNEVIFTSGATEANNLAILGAAHQHEYSGGQRRRIVLSAIEHKSVLEPCQQLASHGWEVIIIPVDSFGVVQWEVAEQAVNEETLLVSLQAANSEIGTIQDMQRMAALAHKKGALLHCDAAQAVGKILVDVEKWEVDMLSLSGHKLYGPKGVGALFVRGGSQRLPLMPLMWGGSQEWGMRPGTAAVPLLVGLGVACQLAAENLAQEIVRLQQLRDDLESHILQNLPNSSVNGNMQNRLPHNSSLTFQGIEAEMLIANLPTVALSAGAACEAGSLEPSRVLLAIGLSHSDAFCTVRIGLGRFTTEEEIIEASQEIIVAEQMLRELIS